MKKLKFPIILIGLLFFNSHIFACERAVVQTANDFYEIGRVGHAIKILEDYIDVVAKDFDAYWLLGNWNFEQGKFDESAKNYQYAIMLRPATKIIIVEKFKVLFEESFFDVKYPAISVAKAAVKIDPSFSDYACKKFLDYGGGITEKEKFCSGF